MPIIFLDNKGIADNSNEHIRESENPFSQLVEDNIESLPEVDELINEVDSLPRVDEDDIDELPELDACTEEIEDLPDVDDDSSDVDMLEEETEESKEDSELTEEEKAEKISQFLNGELSFDEVKEILAEYYAKAVNSNRPWRWGDIPGGDSLTAAQKKEIREYAREQGMVPTAPTREENGKTYADFSEYTVFETVLDEEDWKKTDKEQFDICNQALKEAIENDPELAKQFTQEQLDQIMLGETPRGYTWHHSEKDGTMQLVPFGIHNITNHHGGRSENEWADAPRSFI